jgi:hypothetical protein
VILVACSGAGGSGATGPAGQGTAATSIAFSFTGLRALDPATEGTYAAWTADAAGQLHSLGAFASTSAVTLSLQAPADGTDLWITVQRPGDSSSSPSAQKLLRGTLHGGHADLSVVGAVTQGTLALRQHPGQFTMFTPSNNATDGYPSHEEAGVWLFNMQPRETEQGDMWVRLTQLDPGWTYEGWMVRDIGLSGAIWLSYGKFLPDYTGTINSRDDTGWGPFSGVVNFRTDGEEEFPGDDWLSNPLGFPFPKELRLPLDLREQTASGASRWTHVITIEPAWNRGEPIGSERPFLIQPYQDPFGTGGPGLPRTITFHPEGLPSGKADLR